MTIIDIIKQKLSKVLLKLNIDCTELYVKRSKFARFGDYQIDGINNLSKKLNISSSKLANVIINSIDLHCIAEKVSFFKTGFINIVLSETFIKHKMLQMCVSYRLGIKKRSNKKIIIDYSSPNLAKEMHVGHIRSTVIGDSIARMLYFLGYNVIRVNHVGDWGLNFGMIIAWIKKNKMTSKVYLSNLDRLYTAARYLFNKSETFSTLSKQCTIKLQNGDEYCHNIWKQIVNFSLIRNQRIYNKLDISLDKTNVTGESFYRHMLQDIVDDLMLKKIAIVDKGSIVVRIKSAKNATYVCTVIQKEDGRYLYSTIDLACISYRCNILNANKIIYCVDARQKQYLNDIYIISKEAGYIPSSVFIHHYVFGMVLNKDGKPYKTRYGKTIKLIKLINKSIKLASKLVKQKNPSISNIDLQKASQVIGIGAIKYADLSKHRMTNYIFNWNTIVNFNGNTSLYLQYMYVRIKSVLRKSMVNRKMFYNSLCICTNCERNLIKKMCLFEEALLASANNGMPHILCNYLYDIACDFSHFYEKYKIASCSNISLKISRLTISFIMARILKLGLRLLGIKVIDKM